MDATEERPSDHTLGFSAVALALLSAAAVLPLDAPPLSLLSCPLRAATGWPCLFCGATHAFHHFVRGDFAQALLASPLGALFAFACGLLLLVTAARLCGLRLELPSLPSPRRWRLCVVILLGVNWAFVAARIRGVL